MTITWRYRLIRARFRQRRRERDERQRLVERLAQNGVIK